jgi:uncharacterized protein YukJ
MLQLRFIGYPMEVCKFTERLNHFKNNEKPEAVLVIAKDQVLIKIIIAWTNLQIKQNDVLTELSSDSEKDTWVWLWENCRFSLADLRTIIGVPYSDSGLQKQLEPLIANRIIYPDGTVDSFVQRYLRNEVAKLFDGKARKRTKSDGN